MTRIVVIAALLLALGAALGLWLWGQGRGSGDALPPPLAALERHFVAAGLDVKGSLARAAGRERLRHNVHFALRGSPRVFFVQWFETPDAAQRYLQTLQRYPASAASLANGELVLALSDWPADDAQTERVRAAFLSFAAPGAAVTR